MKFRIFASATLGLLCSVFLSFVFVRCGSVDVANLDPNDFSGSGVCDGVSDDFETKVLPIFSSKGCTAASCHSTAAAAGTLSLEGTTQEVYDAATGSGRVNTSDAASSDLLLKPVGAHPDSHAGGKIFDSVSDSSYITMFCWIDEGATRVDETPDDTGGGTTLEATLSSIQSEVFDVSCATALCHDATTQAQGLDLSAGKSLAAMLGVTSTQEAPKVLLVAGSADTSYLIEKLEAKQTVGNKMPSGGASALDQADIDIIRAWIDADAVD